MTAIASAQRLLAKVLPESAMKSLASLRARLPLHLPQAPPIAVMYVNDGVTRSFVGINNFYSFLLADEITEAIAELQFFAFDGARVLVHRVPLAHFGAETIDVEALFARHDIASPYGIVAAQITPRHPRRDAYRELGRVFSQFFVFYEGAGSVAQVHPLSQIGAHNAVGEPFESSQLITTAGLIELDVLQYNPSAEARAIEHRLLDAETREIVARAPATIRALGACCTQFRLAELAAVPERLLFSADRLPSGNSKPMLRRRFASGITTMSHA